MSLEDYLNKIEPYSRNIIIDLQNSDKLKIQLTIEIKFISSRDVRSDNIKFTSYNYAKEVVDKLFTSLYLIYQINLETSIRGSDFIFDSFQMM